MKFFGLPNQHIIDYKKCKEVFCFDDKGEFETNDPKLIEWIKKNKPFLRYEEVKAKEQAEKPKVEEKKKPVKKPTKKPTAKGDKIKK